nr:hypothetical protein [Tanacetum cinerariifolium]
VFDFFLAIQSQVEKEYWLRISCCRLQTGSRI